MLRTFLLLLFISPVPAVAQIVRGTVNDPAANAGVGAVTIRLLGSSDRVLLTTTSDPAGQFVMVLPKDQAVRIRAERVGYETVTSEELVARAGEVLQIQVVMSRQAIEVEGVTVVARRQVEPRLRAFELRAATYGKSGAGRIWTRDYFEEQRPALMSHFVRLIPSRPDAAPLPDAQEYATCFEHGYYVDNVPTDAADLDVVVAPDQVEGVELYRDTNIPPEIQPYFTRKDPPFEVPYCAVLLIWRKPYTQLYARTRPVSKWHIMAVVGVIAGLIAAQETFF